MSGRTKRCGPYDRRALLFLTLPLVFSAWQAILAVLLGVMWLMRRHEPAYGVLAAAMALGVIRLSPRPPLARSPLSRLNAVLIASAPLESGLRPDLRRRVSSAWQWPRYCWLLFVPGLLIAAIGIVRQARLVARALSVARPADGSCRC